MHLTSPTHSSCFLNHSIYELGWQTWILESTWTCTQLYKNNLDAMATGDYRRGRQPSVICFLDYVCVHSTKQATGGVYNMSGLMWRLSGELWRPPVKCTSSDNEVWCFSYNHWLHALQLRMFDHVGHSEVECFFPVDFTHSITFATLKYDVFPIFFTRFNRVKNIKGFSLANKFGSQKM